MTDICIAVPTLGDRVDLLEDCLSSIKSQSVQGLTVAVVGPSASKARDVADAAGVAYVPLDERGLSRAINHAWRERGGDAEFWAWLGDDDLLAPGSLESAISAFRARAGAVAVYGRCRFGWSDGTTQYLARPGRLASLWLNFGQDRIPQQGSLFSAAAVREVGWLDESLRYAMDADIFLRLKNVGRLVYVPVELGFYRQHEGAISYNKGDAGAEARDVRAKHAVPLARAISRVLPGPVRALDRLYGVAVRHLPSPPPPNGYVGRFESKRSWLQSLRRLQGQGPL